jgi:HlyD family secretion protein
MTTKPPATTPLTTANPPQSNGLAAPPTNSPPHAPNGTPNGSPIPVPSRLPKARKLGRGSKWLIALLVLIVAGGVSFGGWYFFAHRNTTLPGLILHKVKKENMQITITERGSLESAENNELSCGVKAKQPNAPATSIRWVIDNGSIVRKGDRLMDLDDSTLQDQHNDQEIKVVTAEGALRQAEQDYLIALSDAEGAIQTQATLREVNKITLDEYVKGQFQQLKIDAENKVTVASSDLAMWEERAAWSDRMSRPGRQYVTTSQAEADQARLLSARLTLNNLEKQLEVLSKLTKEKTQTDLQGKIDEAQRALDRAKLQAKAKELKADSVLQTAKLTYEKELMKLRDIDREIDKCYLRAPQSGMVVYYVEERARWSATPTMIAQGESVKEGQKLISIPDLTRMQVNARVHEAMVSHVRGDVTVDTGYTEAVNTALLFTPNPLIGATTYAAFQTDLRTPFSLENRRYEKRLISRGLEATVRLNAFSGRLLKGHVKHVDTVASQADMFGSDVKVYKTLISIDESMEGLRPGMDASITIDVDSLPEPVVAIPLQAVMGTVDMGSKRKCFVMTPDGPEMREIVLGMTNEKIVEVKEGLKEDDVIVLNPVVLLTEKQKMEYGTLPAQSQRNSAGYDGKGKGGAPGGGKGKGGKGKGGGMRGGPKGGPPNGAPQGGAPQGGPGGGR